MADSIEGEEHVVMHIDIVVIHELSFVNEPRWILVIMTCAKHANLTYGNTGSLYVKKMCYDLDITWLFNTAKSDEHEIY